MQMGHWRYNARLVAKGHNLKCEIDFKTHISFSPFPSFKTQIEQEVGRSKTMLVLLNDHISITKNLTLSLFTNKFCSCLAL